MIATHLRFALARLLLRISGACRAAARRLQTGGDRFLERHYDRAHAYLSVSAVAQESCPTGGCPCACMAITCRCDCHDKISNPSRRRSMMSAGLSHW